jgi:hypothetical protein
LQSFFLAGDSQYSCHYDLTLLLDNVGRWLNKWINHQHLATADSCCAGVELAPWVEHFLGELVPSRRRRTQVPFLIRPAVVGIGLAGRRVHPIAPILFALRTGAGLAGASPVTTVAVN